jgi:phage-related protein
MTQRSLIIPCEVFYLGDKDTNFGAFIQLFLKDAGHFETCSKMTSLQHRCLLPLLCCEVLKVYIHRKNFSILFLYLETKRYFCPLLTYNKMNKRPIRVVLLDEALEFILSLPPKAREKVIYNYQKIEQGYKDNELFKKLENSNIWEFRTLFNETSYRLFAFWDTETDTLVVATHGIIKKTQKTPQKEIAKAEEIRRQYFED